MATKVDTDVKVKITGDASKLNGELDKAGNKAQQMGDKAKAAGEKAKGGMDKAKAGAESAAVKFGIVTIAIQGFTAQVAGMGQMILDFRTKLITLDKTIVGLQSQELALTRMQEDLQHAVEEGTISIRDYNRALQDIELQYKNVILETQNVEAETHKLSGEYVSFGIQVVSMASQVGIAMVAMGVTSTSVTTAMVAGIGAIRTALTFLQTHPVFIVISAALAIWETNLLGIRGAIEDTFGTESLSIVENINNVFTDMSKSSMPELNNEASNLSNTFKEMNPWVEKNTEELEKNEKAAKKAGESYGRLTHEMEKAIRISGNRASNSGFSSGGGTTLSERLNAEADAINLATIKTMAARSLHDALESNGFSGDIRGANISGSLNPGGIGPVRRKGGPLGGLGPEIMAASGILENQGVSPERISEILSESFVNSSGRRGTGINGMSGLTRSGTLSSSRGAGRGKRRSGRDRNPLGRNNRFSTQRRKAGIAMRERLNEEFGFDFDEFTGASGFGRFSHRFRAVNIGNGVLSFAQGRSRQREAFREHLLRQESEGRRRIDRFNTVTTGAGMDEALTLINQGFGLDRFDIFDASAGLTGQIQTVIQARNFFSKKSNVDFDSMDKSGVAGLLNIKEFGFREMNEQLAFQGEEQFMTVGT